MARWQRVLAGIATDVEALFDNIKHRLFDRPHCDDDLIIVPYIGYGWQDKLSLHGRVLQDSGITSAEENDSIWDNLLNMVRRFNSHEIPGATLCARFGDWEAEIVTDDEGYFHIEIIPPQPLPAGGPVWHAVELELLACPDEALVQDVRAVGRVMVPPRDAQFGVISDIDDTVLRSNSLNYLKLARNVFLKNARTRLPFEGVSAFYKALQEGSQSTFNPIFYLSKSPWNLFDLLIDFFEIRGIPLGPLFLVDLGISPDKLLTPNTHKYKLGHIQLLLDTYEHLPFILIGDSGEKDADIYVEVAEQYPGRILAIYIRDVTGSWRDAALDSLRARAEAAGVEMILAADTGVAAAHALAQGFIQPDAYPQVIEERAKDQQAALPLGKLLDPEAKASKEGET